MAYLVSNNNRTDLKFQETTIGRLSTNLIALNDPTVSKNHATINHLPSNKKFYLTDLNTVNGTFLNGTKLEPNKRYQIKHKDSIQFGKCKIFNIKMYIFLISIKVSLKMRRKVRSTLKIIAFSWIVMKISVSPKQ